MARALIPESVCTYAATLLPRSRASFILLSISKPVWSQRKWTIWWWSRLMFQTAVKILRQKCSSCAIWKTMFDEVHASGARLVFCGDLNIARSERDVHPKERNPAIIGQRPEERELFERILGHGLVDVGRALDPDNENLFTWWAPWRRMRERNIGWRLDYVLATQSLAARASQCLVYREIGTSDHAPVVALFDLDDDTGETVTAEPI